MPTGHQTQPPLAFAHGHPSRARCSPHTCEKASARGTRSRGDETRHCFPVCPRARDWEPHWAPRRCPHITPQTWPGYRAPKGMLHRGLLAPCCSEGHQPTHPTKVPVPVSDPKALGLGQPGFVAGQTREFSSLQHCRPASRPIPHPWGAVPHLRRFLETSLMN